MLLVSIIQHHYWLLLNWILHLLHVCAVISKELLILVDEQGPLNCFSIVLKPRMLEALLCSGPLCRVSLKHLEEEVFAIGTYVAWEVFIH